MGLITKDFTFSAGAIITASEHNQNFDEIYTEFNGNIQNANIASDAAIVDTKLAQITTASKVTFGALTVASEAQGDVMYRNASAWVRLGTGTNGQLLTSGGAGANLSWTTVSSSKPNIEIWWPASATLPLEAADSVAPLVKEEGTNLDQLVVAYDAATDEGRMVQFVCPSDLGTGNVTFRIIWYPATASTNNVIWDVRYTLTGAGGETWDAALTTKAFAASAGDAQQDEITQATVTETVANLGWAANDLISLHVYRDANNASDTIAGDAYMIGIGISIPRA